VESRPVIRGWTACLLPWGTLFRVESQAERRELGWFLGGLAGLSAAVYVWILGFVPLEQLGVIHSATLMLCPGVAALFASWLGRRSLRGLGWGWCGFRSLGVAYVWPLVLCSVVYPGVWVSGVADLHVERLGAAAAARGLDGMGPVGAFVALLATVPLGLVTDWLPALGEELGWRGLLQPALTRRVGFGLGSVATGMIWAAWHYPLIFTVVPTLETAPPIWLALPAFTVLASALSVVMGRLRVQTSSLWPAVVLHASFNLHVQGFFDRLTLDTSGRAFWLVGEYGVVTPVAAWMLAVWFGRRRALGSADPGRAGRRRHQSL
jgi:uncharacterized protein